MERNVVCHMRHTATVVAATAIFLCAAEQALPAESSDPLALSLSPEVGYVLETHPPATSSSPVVIHIQEAHTNYDAQRHIVDILEQLIRDYGLRLILVEGGSGEAGLAYLRHYGPKENRLKVGEKYLKAGVISAEGYLDIVSDYSLILWGVEDASLYERHVQAFLEAEPLEASVKRGVARLRQATDALTPRLLDAQLIELNQAVGEFEARRMELAPYIEVVAKAAKRAGMALTGYLHLNRMVALQELEASLDLKEVSKEHAALVSDLAAALDQPAVDDLLAKARQMKAGTLSKDAYYTHLKTLATRSTVNLSSSPNLSRYLQYVTERPTIDVMALSHELRRVVEALRTSLAKTPESRQLQTLTETLDLLEPFADFRLTPEEYQRVERIDMAHAPDAWVAFLNGQLIRHNLPAQPLEEVARFKQTFPRLARFYDLASQRDDALITKTMAKLDESQERVAVLITGGFHSDRITQVLRRHGVGVVVIAPKITQPTDERLYHAVLKYTNGQGRLSDVLAIANQATNNR